MIRAAEAHYVMLAAAEKASIGLDTVAANVRKGEIALNALITGAGLARAGPMLESMLGPMGFTGLGLAIGALALAAEKYGPAIAKYFDIFDSEKITAATEAIKKHADAVAALQAPKEDEATRAFKASLPGVDLAGMAAGALGVSGLGEQATDAEQAAIGAREGACRTFKLQHGASEIPSPSESSGPSESAW